MISCKDFFDTLKDSGFDFFTGVPDSLLKNFCFYVDDQLPKEQHIISANEGSAVGIGTGYYLSTGKIPAIYLQNSGLGNTINPLLSIADPEVYSIPMLLIIGWRGEPGVKDEPQHKKQGRVMLPMLESMEIPYSIIDSKADYKAEIKKALEVMREEKRPYVLAIKEGSFEEYKYKGGKPNEFKLTREEAIETVLKFTTKDDAVVCTTGKASRELYEARIRSHEVGRADFLTVGAMGHSSQIALGVALQKKDRKVFCIDGDGALLMHMGSFATIGRLSPKNFIHVMINNGAHESVGGQDTGAFEIDWQNIAKACGYKKTFSLESKSEIEVLNLKEAFDGPIFIEIKVSQGSRKDLGRPKSTPIENKNQFMQVLLKD
jgi:phosphonopyruvate decarboxylase